MSRTTGEASNQINFRMPDSVLKGIDKLAAQNSHDRTAEINGACRHWIKIGGAAGTDESTFEKIAGLEKRLEELENEIARMLDMMEKNNAVLLKVIENNEYTIKCLLQTLPVNSQSDE
jgi:hypothetical protein